MQVLVGLGQLGTRGVDQRHRVLRVVHEEEGRAYIYRPTVRREAARRSALTHVLKTFFDNSAEQAVAALLELKGPKLTEAELQRVARLVNDAKKEGR